MAERASPYYTYLLFVLESLGISASQLAKDAGVSSSTITRFLYKDGYKFVPSSTTIDKIAKASGISPAPFLEARDFHDASMVPFVSDTLYDHRWGLNTEKDIGCIIVIGEANALYARVANLEKIEDYAPLFITIGKVPSSQCFGVVVNGGNLNKIVQDGEILVCVRNDDVAGTPPRRISDGDIAIIERRMQDDGRFIQLSARVVRQDHGRWLFEHASTDERFADDRLESSDLNMPVGFRILGFASFIYRSIQRG